MRERSRHSILLVVALVLLSCGVVDQGPAEETPTVPTAVPPAATTTPVPATSTPEVIEPLALLSSYSSLANVSQRLAGLSGMRSADGTTLTGLQLLERILVDLQYNPQADNSSKEQLLAFLDEYEFPYPGGRIYLVNVATGLYAEAHSLYPWSLQDYTVQEVDNIFIEDSAPQWQDVTRHRGDWSADMPNLSGPWRRDEFTSWAHSHYESRPGRRPGSRRDIPIH